MASDNRAFTVGVPNPGGPGSGMVYFRSNEVKAIVDTPMGTAVFLHGIATPLATVVSGEEVRRALGWHDFVAVEEKQIVC